MEKEPISKPTKDEMQKAKDTMLPTQEKLSEKREKMFIELERMGKTGYVELKHIYHDPESSADLNRIIGVINGHTIDVNGACVGEIDGHQIDTASARQIFKKYSPIAYFNDPHDKISEENAVKEVLEPDLKAAINEIL